jgi:hypothetical protein
MEKRPDFSALLETEIKITKGEAPCVVCDSPDTSKIEDAVLAGAPLTAIARTIKKQGIKKDVHDYTVVKQIKRHMEQHDKKG